MITRSTLLHLRIPFSIFLLPVFLFAVSQIPPGSRENVTLVFFILHFLLYPASNGYNSYFDRDESSIGGLRSPPPVSKNLYRVSLMLDLVALVLGTIISWQFSLMILIYGLVSKAYSHPSVRIKRHALTSWLIAGFFQGFFTFMTTVVGVLEVDFRQLLKPELLTAALLSSLMLWGSFPMTQIYQHQEDRKRGDITLSQRLGLLGTFHFTAVFFLIASAGFIYYFMTYFSISQAIIFLISMLPVITYFGYWYNLVRKDPDKANYDYTMRLNLISSMSLNTCFLLLYFINH